VEKYKKPRRNTDDVRSGNEVVSKGMGGMVEGLMLND
jgi:hypothetical protein